MGRRRADFSFLDDEGEVFVSVSVSGLDWWGDSHNPNWGGGYGIGRQDFDTYLAQGPPKPTPAQIQQAIEQRVRELSANGYAGVERWTFVHARARLAAAADISCFDAHGETLLHAMSGSFTQTLLDAGANPNARNPKTGETPLHVAARCSSHEKITRLLAAGAELEALDDEGRTPLVRALEMIERGDRATRLATVAQLVKSGANTQVSRSDGRRAADFLDQAMH